MRHRLANVIYWAGLFLGGSLLASALLVLLNNSRDADWAVLFAFIGACFGLSGWAIRYVIVGKTEA